jgi:hypothetical protein
MSYLLHNHSCVLLALLTLALPLPAQEQSSTPMVRDENWRRKELQRADKLIHEKHDLSPIHETFAAKDVELLWHYYVLSFSIPMHNFLGMGPHISDESWAKLPPKRQQEIKLNREIHRLARDYLLQTPGHARYIADKIEEAIHHRSDTYRPTLFACLGSLGQDGSDECIVQLGRYLFDPRDPDFIPIDPARPRAAMYDPQGMQHPVMSDATGALGMAITGRFAFAKTLVDENSKPFKNMPVKGYAEKVRHWWLTSEDAAPYRRSLAALGLVLPPGYPPMKEFEGTKTTTAPPLKNPPYPDGATPPSWPEKP